MVQSFSVTDQLGSAGGRLKINSLRGGTINEITEFLSDLDVAYTALYSLTLSEFSISPQFLEDYYSDRFRLPRSRRFSRAFDFTPMLTVTRVALKPDEIRPKYRLELSRVLINSPGFWEFMGAANPLEFIRKFLNDCHERKKDKEYRNLSEKTRLNLENDILEQELVAKKLENIKRQLDIYREFEPIDFDENEMHKRIAQEVWGQVGVPLAKLSRHQDAGLITDCKIE
jgi:hypothetical protein